MLFDAYLILCIALQCFVTSPQGQAHGAVVNADFAAHAGSINSAGDYEEDGRALTGPASPPDAQSTSECKYVTNPRQVRTAGSIPLNAFAGPRALSAGSNESVAQTKFYKTPPERVWRLADLFPDRVKGIVLMAGTLARWDPSLLLRLRPAMLATAKVQGGGGIQQPIGGLPVFTVPGLVLNEVSPGPALSYIELFNGGAVPIDLAGWTIETSTGAYPLDGLPAPLGSNGFFLLLSGHQADVGISEDAEVLCIVVADPACGHLTDTVLLRKPDGSIQDAMSYGVLRDNSPRYSEAVLSGQFQDGTYLSVAEHVGELVMGRDRSGVDTNRVEDWATSGGINALVGSPLGPNAALPTDEFAWVAFFQAHLSVVFAQEYYGVTVVDGDYSGFGAVGVNSICHHVMTLQGGILGTEPIEFAGLVTNSLGALGGDDYVVKSSGTLTGPSGQSVTFMVRRQVGVAQCTLEVQAVLNSGSDEIPYGLVVSRSFSGVRGDFQVAISRAFTGWSGIERATTAAQSLYWNVDSRGIVQSVQSTANAVRPWPIWEGPFTQDPRPVVTMETIALACTATASPGGFTLEWTNAAFSYANDIPSIDASGFVANVVSLYPLEPRVEGVLEGEFRVDGDVVTPMRATGGLVALPGDKLVRWSVEIEPAYLGAFGMDATFDPPINQDEGRFPRLRRFVKRTAQVAGTVAMCATAGVGCIATTVGSGATAVFASTASLGAATPLAVGVAVGGVTACGAITYGAAKVIDEIWSH